MSIKNALNFILNIDTNVELRKSCYSCCSQEELLEMLKAYDLVFTKEDFSEAINLFMVKCQTYEQANRVKEIEDWFKLFHH